MLLVISQHPDKKFLMVFPSPTNKIRKGSKTTYADWCNKHNILWVSTREFYQELYNYATRIQA